MYITLCMSACDTGVFWLVKLFGTVCVLKVTEIQTEVEKLTDCIDRLLKLESSSSS
jgi:uncharacterized protein YpbB